MWRHGMHVLACCVFPLSGYAHEYRIEVSADRNLNVHGAAALKWHNDTGNLVSEIPLQCKCSMSSIAVNGIRVGLRDGRVRLPAPVEAGTSLTIRIEFTGKAKEAYGYRMLTEAWHPKAITWHKGLFNPKQQRADDYEVTLTAPESVVIASAGERVESGLAAAALKRLRWRMEKVTSFGLAASSDFKETRRTSEGVEIRLYELRGESRFDVAMADFAVDAIAFYRQTFGFYPHPALVMLPGSFNNGGGYSPASGFTVYHRNSGEGARWIVAHEIGHQYWGFDTVIDDSDFFHWPGLGLGIYSDQLFMAARGSSYLYSGAGAYRRAAAAGYDTTIKRSRDELKRLKFDWNSAIYHSKAYAVIRMLADLIGSDRFLSVMHVLTSEYRHRWLPAEGFQRTVEAAAQQILGWFFQDWVDSNAQARFAIEQVTTRNGAVEVIVRRKGEARFPVEVKMTSADGGESVQRMAYDAERQTLVFLSTSPPDRVEIDPRGICPMLKDGNEVWTAGDVRIPYDAAQRSP